MKYRLFNLCLSILLAFVVVSTIQAQDIMYKGVVVDEAGEAIIGASVKVMGTGNGTITDLDGKFSLSVPAKGKIEISYVGYITQELSNLKNTRIVLKEDLMKLDEVVVVGYGTQKMRNITGAISTVTPQEITDLSVSSLGSSLSGLVNGLSVSQSSNRPGESASMTVRQSNLTSSFSPGQTSASPLYVIDDYIADETTFNNLDANMVESITVLKDAAAAVYGARSAQGVILVKTKRGQVGAPKISYSGQFGYVDAVSHANMLNSYDYGVLWNGVRAANSTTTSTTDIRKDYFQADELEAMRNLNYNLLEQEWSAAFSQKHSLNISGGSDRATFFAGVSYLTQDGNLGRIDYSRWNYRAGVDAKISKWLKASLQVSGDYGTTNKAYSKVGRETSDTDYNTLLQRPGYIPEEINGRPLATFGITNAEIDTNQYYNYGTVQNLDNYSKDMPQNMTINSSLEYDFGWNKILKGLKFKFSYSKSISTTKGNQYASNYTIYKMQNRGGSGEHLYLGDNLTENDFQAISVDNGNFLSRSMSRADSYQINFIATYARQIGLHDLSGLFTIERSESESEDLKGQKGSPYTFTDGQSNSATGDMSTSFGRSEAGMLSYVGRVNYSYADRYLLEFLIRSDASTKFAPENYWGVFPSLSAGWVLSEESWFKNNIKGIDFMKIRGSFGILGKDNITPWTWMQLYNLNPSKGPIFGTDQKVNSGTTIQLPPKSIPNRDAHWDKSYKINFGIDMRTLNDRLSVNLDAYYDLNRDVFMTRTNSLTFPSTVGAQPTAENYGSIDTYGVELSLGWRDKIGKDFKYYVKLNTGYSDNKIKEKPWADLIPYYDVHPNQRADQGNWGLECIGMFRDYQEIEEYFQKYNISSYLGLKKDQVRPGMLIYNDVRGAQNADGSYQGPDGIVDAELDKVQISKWKSNPYGLTINLGGSWKSFSFSAQLGANWGGYSYISKEARSIYNMASGKSGYEHMAYTNLPSFWANNMYVYQNVYDASGNLIAAQNRDALYPNLRYSENSYDSTFWKVSGTRISLRNITIAYTLPKIWMQKIGIESCRLNLTGQNLLSFYNPYPDNFMDPMSRYGNYPTLRKFTLGVNVSF